MIWEMVLCLGMNWGVCGTTLISEYPSQQSCQEALDGIRFTSDAPKRGAVAFCRPRAAK